MKHSCWIPVFSLKKKLRTRTNDFKFPRGQMTKNFHLRFPLGQLPHGNSFPGEILHENL
jgi:hypothetical protein